MSKAPVALEVVVRVRKECAARRVILAPAMGRCWGSCTTAWTWPKVLA